MNMELGVIHGSREPFCHCQFAIGPSLRVFSSAIGALDLVAGRSHSTDLEGCEKEATAETL